jgi:hypothetical protein
MHRKNISVQIAITAAGIIGTKIGERKKFTAFEMGNH